MRARNRWGVLVLLAGAMAACSGGTSTPTCSYHDPAAAAVSSPWPKFHHDEQNTGAVANVQLPGTPTCRWVFPPGGADSCSTALTTPAKGAFAASPVISNDGSRIYIGSADGTLYALYTSDGTQLASTDFSFSIAQPGGIVSTALVAQRDEGEVVFVGGGNGSLYGLTNTGVAQATYWPDAIGGFISASPSLVGEGTVCVDSLNGTFVAVCPNGVTRFAVSTGPSQSSPAQAPDGTLDFGADDGQLRAVGVNGIVNWSFSAAGPIRAAPVFDTATNSIYVADRAGWVFKVIAGGSLAGRPDAKFVAFEQVGPISSSPALAEDHLYFGSDDGNLYAIDKCTGTPAWSPPFPTGGAIASSPAVAIIASEPPQPFTCSSSGSPAVHQRIVVVGSDDGNVYFLQDNGTSVALVAVFSIGAPVGSSSPAIGSDGAVYVGASDGRVYAIGEPLPSPTPSS
ncbi:MAG: PQQ-binding-like beta-propeller repeat protein [Candidatus Binatia bacterium]|jgi:outer membrane protein assembly factor BamB